MPLCPDHRCLPVRRWLGQAHARAQSGPASARSVAPSGSPVTPSWTTRRVCSEREIDPDRDRADRPAARPAGREPGAASRIARRGSGGGGPAGRLPGARAHRLPAAGPRLGGLDAAGRPASGRARARHRGPVGDRLVRGGIGRPPAVHRGGPHRGRRDPARAPQAVPADLRPVRRASVLRGRRCPAGRAVAARRRDRHRRLRGLLASRRPAVAGARWRPDPGQRLLVARGAISPRPTRSVSVPRHRGARSCGRTPS